MQDLEIAPKDLHQLYELSINFNKLARIHLVRSINRKIIREEEFYTLDAEARYKALLANENGCYVQYP